MGDIVGLRAGFLVVRVREEVYEIFICANVFVFSVQVANSVQCLGLLEILRIHVEQRMIHVLLTLWETIISPLAL